MWLNILWFVVGVVVGVISLSAFDVWMDRRVTTAKKRRKASAEKGANTRRTKALKAAVDKVVEADFNKGMERPNGATEQHLQ